MKNPQRNKYKMEQKYKYVSRARNPFKINDSEVINPPVCLSMP